MEDQQHLVDLRSRLLETLVERIIQARCFGTNVELHDSDYWKQLTEQIQEIDKAIK
jgi:hypothetical protein